MKYILPALTAYCLIAFAASALDKRAARRGARRLPEKAMVFFAFTGGGPGVLMAFYSLRHKTRHRGLLALVWTGTAVSYALIIWLWVRFA